MKRKYFLISAIAVALLIIAGAAFGIFFWNEKTNGHVLKLYGNVDLRQVDLGFRVFGKLKTMHFQEGDIVKQGDLLATLDDTPYTLNVREREERVHSLDENLAYTNIQLNRRKKLVEGYSVSEEDYQHALYQQKAQEANLREADAAMENAKVSLEDTRLIAPSDGIVYSRVREPGSILNIGEPVYSVALNQPIWIRTYISEANLGRIYQGMPAEIHTDTKENPIYKGQIGFISPIAEFTPKNIETPDLRTSLVYQLRIFIENPDKGLRQGMPVTVHFTKKKGEAK